MVSKEVKRRHYFYQRTGTLECWASPRRWCNYNNPDNEERRSSGTPIVGREQAGSRQAAQPPGHRLVISELPKIQLWHNAAAGCKLEKQIAWLNPVILISFQSISISITFYKRLSQKGSFFNFNPIFFSLTQAALSTCQRDEFSQILCAFDPSMLKTFP